MDTINFFKNLKPSDWDVLATKKWRVKDVLAHLVGWEREVAKALVRVFEAEEKPWFVLIENSNACNLLYIGRE
ncbi:MAG: hypothetical protein NTV81_04060 [Candidatus Komeilibacteria bacterium]|nr:hypothetical protein [Candidatus Komeilibacteria bacterium]